MTRNQISYHQLQENMRQNRVNEAELHRSNVAKEENATGQLNETVRSNLAKEGLNERQLNESVRHNKKSESIETAKTVVAGINAAGQVLKGVGSII